MEDLNYSIRELQTADYDKGFLDCLKELTTVGHIEKQSFIDRFNDRKSRGIFTAVACDNKSGQILGTGSVFYEPKFIRQCSTKAYIEDVCVSANAQKKGIGKMLVQFLRDKALNDNCYKVVLSCSEANKDFYRRLEFENNEASMSIYSKKHK